METDAAAAQTPSNMNAETNPPGESYNRKDKSLSVICEQFVQQYGIPNTVINVTETAEALGTQRRRIYDIINVFEAINLMQKQKKNMYIWLGLEHLPATFQNLYQEAQVEIASAESACDTKAENTLTRLTQRIVQMFLLSKTKTFTLEDAARCLLADSTESTQFKTKVRRLYDIVNILAIIQLTQKVATTTAGDKKRKSGFMWIGPSIVVDSAPGTVGYSSEQQQQPAEVVEDQANNVKGNSRKKKTKANGKGDTETGNTDQQPAKRARRAKTAAAKEQAAEEALNDDNDAVQQPQGQEATEAQNNNNAHLTTEQAEEAIQLNPLKRFIKMEQGTLPDPLPPRQQQQQQPASNNPQLATHIMMGLDGSIPDAQQQQLMWNVAAAGGGIISGAPAPPMWPPHSIYAGGNAYWPTVGAIVDGSGTPEQQQQQHMQQMHEASMAAAAGMHHPAQQQMMMGGPPQGYSLPPFPTSANALNPGPPGILLDPATGAAVNEHPQNGAWNSHLANTYQAYNVFQGMFHLKLPNAVEDEEEEEEEEEEEAAVATGAPSNR